MGIASPKGNVEGKELAANERGVQAGTSSAQSDNPADQLPAGEGRDLTVRVCSKCHSVSKFSQLRYSENRWQLVLDDMVAKGMDAPDDDVEAIKKYLVAHLGPASDGKSNTGN
jgi:quinoprotein glucose dehydrogenase